MKSWSIALAIALCQFAGYVRVHAQSVDGLRIEVRVAVGRADGGDRRNTGFTIDPANIGKTSRFAFSRLADVCGTHVGPEPLDAGQGSDGTMKKLASAWTVQVTPTGRAGGAVTFRMQWMRSRDNGKPSSVSDDMQLTLGPGQSLSLDVMPQGPTASTPPAVCTMYLSVAVEHVPEPDRDRRLLAVDLWLVDRLPGGTERSQPLSLKGLYNQPIPFYFDTLTEGAKTLDVFGDLLISPGERTSEIKITTRSRVSDLKPAQRPAGYPAEAPWPVQYVGLKTATLRLVPNEVVSVSLPPVGDEGADAAAFAGRNLSFRVRVRQIR